MRATRSLKRGTRNRAPGVFVVEDGAALFRVRVLWKGCEIWVWDAVAGKAETYTKRSDAERGGWRALRRLGYRDLFCREGLCMKNNFTKANVAMGKTGEKNADKNDN